MEASATLGDRKEERVEYLWNDTDVDLDESKRRRGHTQTQGCLQKWGWQN